MAQAAVSDGEFLDPLPFREDGFAPSEVDIGGGQVAEALVVAAVVVVVDESGDGGLELAGQEVVFQQDAVLQGLVPALDLALGLGVVRGAANMGDALALEPGLDRPRLRLVAAGPGGDLVRGFLDDAVGWAGDPSRRGRAAARRRSAAPGCRGRRGRGFGSG